MQVKSREGKVSGRVDKAIDTRNGVILQDYKSGSIFSSAGPNGGNLKERYKSQMKLYASLYHASYGVWPVCLQLVALGGEVRKVNYTVREGVDLLDEARRLLENINQRVNDVQEGRAQTPVLADPDTEACSVCNFRPACQSYWRARGGGSSEWPPDLRGHVRETEVDSEDRLLLRLLTSPDQCKKVVHGIEPNMVRGEDAHDLVKDSWVEVYNLYQKSEEVYKATKYTVGYFQ
ncbi:hypothetical protein GGP53_001023 [Salinibacter ruber]|nr:hypothetical protein [Salinibacter ruber]MCS4144089.1 hypothetical protein [Salinibacter ruber]